MKPKKTNYVGIAALIFSLPPFVFMCGAGLLGFILSIFGMRFAKKNDGEGRQISFAALLISGVILFLFIALFTLMISVSIFSSLE